MQIIRQRAHARVGLIGNPSDGYHGKTISFILRDFCAEIVLYDWDRLEIISSGEDQSGFDSIDDLVRDVQLHGYYGGIRLVKATIKKFADYCAAVDQPLPPRTFAVRYQTNIPRLLGLAGSSAIIIATLRALMDFFQVRIPLEVQPSLALAVENQELGIPGGLQDRVIQVYEGLVYMDFSEQSSRREPALQLEYGQYEPLDATWLPPLYVAYTSDASNPTEVFHNDLRGRFNRGETAVVDAMQTFAELAREARSALLARDVDKLSSLMNRNFDTRRSICRLPEQQVALIEEARRVGCSAKFAGSGGAIVGCYRDDAMLAELREHLARTLGCTVLVPTILPAGSAAATRASVA